MRLELTALAGSCWGPEPESVAAQQQFAGCIAIVGYRVKYSGVPVRPCAHEVGSCACAAFSSRRTRSPSVANGTVSALVDQLDRALHDHSSVDAFLELDEQLPPHQQLLRHLHDLSVSRIFRGLSPLPVESPRGLHYLLLQLSLQHAQEELQITTTFGYQLQLTHAPDRIVGHPSWLLSGTAPILLEGLPLLDTLPRCSALS